MKAIKERRTKRLYFSLLDLKGLRAGKTGGGLERMVQMQGEDTSTFFKPLKQSFSVSQHGTGCFWVHRYKQNRVSM